MIFLDVKYYKDELNGIEQVFGHTITFPNYDPKAWAIRPDGFNWSMIDASRAFMIDLNGNINPLEN